MNTNNKIAIWKVPLEKYYDSVCNSKAPAKHSKKFNSTFQEVLNGYQEVIMRLGKETIRNCRNSLDEKNFIIKGGLTPYNLRKLSEHLDLDEDIAKRYFERKCSCGKELEVQEVGMFLRYMGRYFNLKEDSRTYLCKDCFCKENNMSGKEYWEHIYQNMVDGCNLF